MYLMKERRSSLWAIGGGVVFYYFARERSGRQNSTVVLNGERKTCLLDVNDRELAQVEINLDFECGGFSMN